MSTTIYYFSATGNSLEFAKNLATELQTKNLNAIAELTENEELKYQSERIGIVCPTYAWGIPRIVEEFLEKLAIKGNPYIFAIISCVGIPGKSLKVIDDILQKKGTNLNAGFIIKAPCSSLAKKNTLDNIIIGLDRKRKKLKTGRERLHEIAKTVENFQDHKPETSSWPANYFGSIFHGYALDFFKTAAQSFEVKNENCTGCGTCVRVCPRANISLVNKNPVFLNNCEFCHACVQWCPEFAISHPNFEADKKQYRNPNVKLSELIVNA